MILKKRKYSLTDTLVKRAIYYAAFISIVFFIIQAFDAPGIPTGYEAEMKSAAEKMKTVIDSVAQYRQLTGKEPDLVSDPNFTGLIGPEYSDIVTSVGHLEAKRTSLNPDMASLIVHLMKTAGVEQGDTVAVGSSGSFPGLLIAALAAAEVMQVHPVVIISLGASSFGASDPDFTLLEIYDLLINKKLFTVGPAAVSLGGHNDSGQEFEDYILQKMQKRIEASGIPLIEKTDLRQNVAARMRIYQSENEDISSIKLFINAGGSWANMGESPLILEVKSGLNVSLEIPPVEQRGVIFAMAAEGIPVIHLLNMRGLVQRYRLPWDPVPSPEPGSWRPTSEMADNTRFIIISTGYLIALVLLILYVTAARRRVPTN